jgi:hypothetical protein
MSLNVLKNQVKYCLLSVDDEEIKLLRQKNKRAKFKNIKKEKIEKNLKYFELQEKYKTVSKNVLKYLKLLNNKS